MVTTNKCCPKCEHTPADPDKGRYQAWCKDAKCECHSPTVEPTEECFCEYHRRKGVKEAMWHCPVHGLQKFIATADGGRIGRWGPPTETGWETLKYKAPRDDAFWNALETVLDEEFPKVEEEGPAKVAMRRGNALVLFTEANAIHSALLTLATQQTKEEVVKMVEGMRTSKEKENVVGEESIEGKNRRTGYNRAVDDIIKNLKGVG